MSGTVPNESVVQPSDIDDVEEESEGAVGPATPVKEEREAVLVEPGSKRTHKPNVISFILDSTSEQQNESVQRLDFSDNAEETSAGEGDDSDGRAAANGLVDEEDLDLQQENIVARLVKIRDCKRQVIDMLDAMKAKDPQEFDRDMLRRLIGAYDGFKEQEEQYMDVLQNIVLVRKSRLALVNGHGEGEIAEADAHSEPEQTQSEPEPELELDAASAPPESLTLDNEQVEIDELRDLYEQREMLKKMVEEQKKVKTEQQTKIGMLKEQQELEQETKRARTLVSKEAESVAAKRRELDELRNQLSSLKGIYEEVTGGPVDIQNLENLSEQQTNDPSATQQQQPSSSDDDCPAPSWPSTDQLLQNQLQSLQEKKERMNEMFTELSTFDEAIDGQEMIQTVTEEVTDNEPEQDETVESVHQQLRELSTVKERLLQLQRLTQSAQQAIDAGETLPEEVQDQLESASEELESTAAKIDAADPFTSAEQQRDELRSDYEINLAKQQSALDSLQAERTRLTEIKNDYLKLRDSDSATANFYAASLNNATSNSQPERQVFSAREHSSRPSQSGPVINTSRGDAEASMVRNPRLASFRRNNQLTGTGPAVTQTPRQPTSTNIYPPLNTDISTPRSRQSNFHDQLYEHFDSIKSIFEHVAEQPASEPTSARPVSVPMADPQTAMWQQQMLLTTSLLQQQLQMQQMEMAKLQNTVVQMNMTTGQMSTPVQPQIPMMMPTFPHQFDGRPLSSASLNNLFAPLPFYQNPYQHPAAAVLSPNRAQNLNQTWHPGFAVTRQEQQDLAASYATPFADSTEMKVRQSMDTEGNVPRLDISTGSNKAQKQSNVVTKTKNLLRATASTNSVERRTPNKHSLNNIAGDDVFDSLRENIYAEVATLISQNEQRPEFLVELFRELQLLSNEYLRERALQAIRDLLNRYLTTTATETETEDDGQEQTADDVDSSPNATARLNPTSTILVSAPDVTSDDDFAPIHAIDTSDVSDTVVSCPTASSGKLNKKNQKPKRFENFEDIKDVKTVLNNSPQAVNGFGAASRKQEIERIKNGTKEGEANVDMGGLETQIESIIDELIPFVKENASSSCTPQLLQYLRKLMLTLAASKCLPAGAMTDFFQRQLSSILDDTLAKYSGQNLEACSEELLSDVSEVIFNEMAFFRLMHNIDSQETAAQQQENRARRVSLITETESSLKVIENETRSRRSTPQRCIKNDLNPHKEPNCSAKSEMSEDQVSVDTSVSAAKEVAKVNCEDEDLLTEQTQLPTIAVGDSAVTVGGGNSVRYEATSPDESPSEEIPEDMETTEISSQGSTQPSSASASDPATFNFGPVQSAAELTVTLESTNEQTG